MQALWRENEVKLHDTELSRRRNANYEYLMSLSKKNLLLNYQLEAGRFSNDHIPKDMHGGWESPTCQLRGHFPGHWLSAAAMQYYATGDKEIKARAEAMVAELALCQIDNGGQWVASIPEKYLHWIANGKGVWAPQYTIHKTFLGLVDMARYADCKQALEVAENFAKWFSQWSESFTKEKFDDILDVETGGMLEIWVILYDLTKKDIYKKLIDKYYRGRLFDTLLDGKDPLTNMHANTTIPEVVACARAYDVLGEKRWRDIVEAYWECAVTSRGQYATGGQTCGEIWTPIQKMDNRLGLKNQEYCTVYNMMRLSEYLLRWTGDAKYADYWEQNLYNGIMAQSYWKSNLTHGASSKDPDFGLLTYFLPMTPGAKKGWASKTESFFCCHGTLVQSNSLFSRGIYYRDRDDIYVCQYFNSELSFDVNGKKVKINQKRDNITGLIPFGYSDQGLQAITQVTSKQQRNPDCHVACFQIELDTDTELNLFFRVPYWIKDDFTVYINDKKEKVKSPEKGFIHLSRAWKNGDIIKLVFPMGIRMSSIPGNDKLVAFHYGPITLAGLTNKARTLKLPKSPSDLLTHDNEREWGSWKSTFRTVGQDKNIRFVPIYDVGYENYSIYFDIT